MAKLASNSNTKILEHCRIAPPRASVPSTSLPLTFFDIPFLLCSPVQRLFFFQYPHTDHFMQTILPSLKHSLSLALQHFFPFAANLVYLPKPQKPYILYVDGDAVQFAVTESTADFSHLIANYPRDVKDLHPLTPEIPVARELEDGSRAAPLMAIQVTVLPGSGFCIGVTFRHVAADGRAFHHFMKSWASICKTKGCLEEPEPSHNRFEIKSSNELERIFLNEWWNWAPEWRADKDLNHDVFVDEVRTTILLGQAQIEKLRHLISIQVITPVSTFVLVCALIWVCLVKSEKEIFDFSNNDQLCCFLFFADCRGHYGFSIPSTYFGNCVAYCYVAFVKRKKLVGEFGYVEAVKAIGRKVKELEDGAFKDTEKWVQYSKEIVALNHHVVMAAASPKFNVYQTDFGFGKLKKSEVVHIDIASIISFAEARDEKGGVEVGLATPKVQMDKFNNIFKSFLT